MQAQTQNEWTLYPPRKWQSEALPKIIDSIKRGEKPICCAIMGAGKSVLIAELCARALLRLKDKGRVVVCAPRQSLVRQLSKTIQDRVQEPVGQFYTQSKDIDTRIIVACNASVATLASQLSEHNLFVAMMVGDEVHGSESDGFKDAYADLDPRCAIGFTATPYRSDEKETLSLWTNIAYSYGVSEALKDGVIVPWKLAHWTGHGCSDIDEVCIHLIKTHQKLYGRQPGLVSSLSIDDAEAYVIKLNAAGIKAAAVHSQMKREDQDRIMHVDLKSGKIDCIVHVSMLSEGVDLPYLKWMCLRRPVGARVRFVQEVGRVLRSHPDKEFATIMDPHDLFGRHSIQNLEAIGEALRQEELDDYEEELASLEKEEEIRELIRKMPSAQAFTRIESYTRNLLSMLQAHGIVESKGEQFQEDDWRGGDPSENQLNALQRLLWAKRYLPERERKFFEALAAQGRTLTKGVISDMIDCLIGLATISKPQRQRHRHWRFPTNIQLPEIDISIQGLLFAMENN